MLEIHQTLANFLLKNAIENTFYRFFYLTEQCALVATKMVKTLALTRKYIPCVDHNDRYEDAYISRFSLNVHLPTMFQ